MFHGIFISSSFTAFYVSGRSDIISFAEKNFIFYDIFSCYFLGLVGRFGRVNFVNLSG